MIHLCVMPRDDSRRTFSLFFHPGAMSVFATFAGCASCSVASGCASEARVTAFLFTIVQWSQPRYDSTCTVVQWFLIPPSTTLSIMCRK